MLSEKQIEKVRDSIHEYKDEFIEEDRIKDQYDFAEQTEILKNSLSNFGSWMNRISSSQAKWPLGQIPQKDDEKFEDVSVPFEPEF